ncbi:MAG: hypothetical protein Q4A65_02055, partial [Bacillota bacterium]|nr:hypothetical protein [Bacillota bacterium]
GDYIKMNDLITILLYHAIIELAWPPIISNHCCSKPEFQKTTKHPFRTPENGLKNKKFCSK